MPAAALSPLDAGLPSPAAGVFTTRAGGTSLPPYDALNLAYHVGDDWDRAFANRSLLARELGIVVAALSFAQQVHGDGVLVVPAKRVGSNALRRGVRGVDALVTTAVGAPLVILVADCAPVLLADAQAGVVAAVHAGRRGVVANIAGRTVAAMTALGAEPARIVARIGPTICGRCYELPEALADEVEAAAPGSRTTTVGGTPAADLAAGLLGQLRAAGVEDAAKHEACTREDERFFSHRRDGVTGRFAGVVWLRPA